MFSFALQLADARHADSSWLFHPPSVFTMADMAVTSVVVFLLWRHIVRARPMTPRQYARLTARLDQLELAQIQSEKLQAAHRRTAIEVSEAQLKEIRTQTHMLETMARTLTFVSTTVQALPCVMADGSIRQVNPCPGGLPPLPDPNAGDD